MVIFQNLVDEEDINVRPTILLKLNFAFLQFVLN